VTKCGIENIQGRQGEVRQQKYPNRVRYGVPIQQDGEIFIHAQLQRFDTAHFKWVYREGI
jgi:hypothetical protein